MIISPPFLPTLRPATAAVGSQPKLDAETDTEWLERAMAQPTSSALHVKAPVGSFPASASMMWHTGLHIRAPHENSGPLAVRAIADGTVIYFREPTKVSTDPAHPLNFSANGKPYWSDDGCVILKHETDIGSLHGRRTTVVYYTLTMHLSALDPSVMKPNARIYRKDVIGKPGQSYGSEPGIHFEICCNEVNLKALVGREPIWLEHDTPQIPTNHGRLDAVFGDTLIYLPPSTPCFVNRPSSEFRPVLGQVPNIGVGQWVRMNYEKGNAHLTSYNLLGEKFGTTTAEDDAEYKLYKTATALHKKAIADRPSSVSSPSGVYELLRFGRNLGPDPLASDLAHWRQVHTLNGLSWVDLNTPISFKFSDADFLSFTGWNFFNDDKNYLDQRCQSARLARLIQDPDPKNPNRGDANHRPDRMGLPVVRKHFRRAICHLPTEWDQATIEQRHKWICEPENGARQVAPDGWKLFAAHALAMSIPDLPLEYKEAMWRFHPTEFILTMRKCSWLSASELAQCMPRKSPMGTVSWKTALERAGIHSEPMSRILRKYIFNSPLRKAHFLTQIFVETGVLRLVREDGGGRPNPKIEMAQYYSAFYGRGYLQMTWPEKYSDYGFFRGFVSHVGPYGDGRITASSLHVWEAFDPRNELPKYKKWAPKYDVEVVAVDLYSSADAAGFYWVGKTFRQTHNMHRVADLGGLGAMVGYIAWLVNGGGNAYEIRQALFPYVLSVVDDAPRVSGTVLRYFPPLSVPLKAKFPPLPVDAKNSIEVNHEHQVP